MKLTIHTIDSAPDPSKAIMQGIADDLGMVPNLAASIAESPMLLAAFDGLRRAVRSGALNPVHREVSGLAVGVAIDNAYGVAFHSSVLGSLGVDEADIDKMRAGNAPSEVQSAAAYELARQIALNHGKVDEAVLGQATRAGLTTIEILEIVGECTFASLVGMIDNLVGRVELDAFLAPRAWNAPPAH